MAITQFEVQITRTMQMLHLLLGGLLLGGDAFALTPVFQSTSEYSRAPVHLFMKAKGPVGPKSSAPPVRLLEWGCDAELWSQITRKRDLVKLAEIGDAASEERARRRILKLRKMIAETPAEPLPAQLLAWGCDEELWVQIKQKGGLISLAEKGDEEQARKRLARLREIVAETIGDPV